MSKPYCCEVCFWNPTCGNDCGSCSGEAMSSEELLEQGEQRMEKELKYGELLNIVSQVSFRDRSIFVEVLDRGYYIQVQYQEEDVDTGKMEIQKARKWYIESTATETEVVETCFKAIKTSMEHVVKEHFTYKGRRVYSPHFDINARMALCDEKRFDRPHGT